MEFKKHFIIFITWLLSYLAPIVEIMMMIGVLVALDTYLGVKSARKNGVFHSRKLESVVHKSMIYIGAILFAYMAQNTLDIPMILKGTAGYIAYTELVSIDENSKKLVGYSIFKKILDFIKRK